MTHTYQSELLISNIRTLLEDPDTKQVDISLLLGESFDLYHRVQHETPIRANIAHANFSTFFRSQKYDDGSDNTTLIKDANRYSFRLSLDTIEDFNKQLQELLSVDPTLKFVETHETGSSDYLYSITRGFNSEQPYTYDPRYFAGTTQPYLGTFNDGDKIIVHDLMACLDGLLADMDVYKFRLTKNDNGDNEGFSIIVTQSSPHQSRILQMSVNESRASVLRVLALIEEEKSVLEEKLGLIIDSSTDTFHMYFDVEKKLRFNPRQIIKSQRLSKPMWDFLSDAYNAGIDIIVTGATGSGKTTFIRYLYDSNTGNAETLISDPHGELPVSRGKNFTSINGDGASVMDIAQKIKPERLILDEPTYMGENFLSKLADLNDAGISILASMHGSSEKRWDDCADKWPFQIEVALSAMGEVNSIKQITVGNGNLIHRTLWDHGHVFVAEPNRTLRRQISLGLSKSKDVSSLANKGNNVNIVTMSPEEKEKLREAMEIIKKYTSDD